MNIKNIKGEDTFAVVDYVLTTKGIKATHYLSPTLIVRAVRKTYDNNANNKGNIQIIVTIGKPNYVERETIARNKKTKNNAFPFTIFKPIKEDKK